jgi:hypothetical protein
MAVFHECWLAQHLLFSWQLKKIGFPGWPDPNLDSVSGFGASIQKGGLHQPPFLISSILDTLASKLAAGPEQNGITP